MNRQKYNVALRWATMLWLGLTWSIATLPASAQVQTDPALRQTVLKTLDLLYNYEFAEAEPLIAQVRSRYPQSAVGPLLRAVQLQWQHFPLRENGPATAQFTQAAQQAITLAEARLKQAEDDPEALFYAMTAHGYLALLYHNAQQPLKVAGEARQAYGYARKGFSLTEKNPEFYFTTGVYNYYVERYPEDHPMVKPLMLFFKDGNMPLGLQQIDVATRRAVFSRAEARYYLAHILLKHEAQPGRAATYLNALTATFPNNPLYALRSAEALALAGDWDNGRKAVARLRPFPGKLWAMPALVLSGYLAERADGNDVSASATYQQALKLPYNDAYTKEYHALAWAGLARIAARQGNRPQARTYYKKVLDLTEYRALIREAKAFR